MKDIGQIYKLLSRSVNVNEGNKKVPRFFIKEKKNIINISRKFFYNFLLCLANGKFV